MRQWTSIALVGAAAVVCSCEPPAEPVTSQPEQQEWFTPEFRGPASSVLAVADTVRFVGTVRNASGTIVSSPRVRWSSGDSSVIRIDTLGIAVGVARGSTWIKGVLQSYQARWDMTVRGPVASLTVSADTVIVAPGWSIRVRAVALDASGDTVPQRAITWQSSDTAIVYVWPNSAYDPSEAGVRGTAPGSAAATATYHGVSASAAVRVVPIRVARVVAGGDGTCALTPEGAVYCWGSVVPPSEVSLTTRPTALPLTFAPESLAVGEQFACAVDAVGTGRCWGNNSVGQLGMGAVGESGAGREVAGGLQFKQISVGGAHACGMTLDGAVYCWGSNSVGQLGALTATTCAMPEPNIPVPGGGGWNGGGGVIKSIGQSAKMEISCSPAPVRVSSTLRFSAVATGESHSCALAEDGTAYCWGDPFPLRNDAVPSPSPYGPTPIPVAQGWQFVSLVSEHIVTCGLTAGGEAHCWGFVGATYDLGSGAYRSLAAGWAHTCGIGMDGTTSCWGSNTFGELGGGSVVGLSSMAPVGVAGGIAFKSLALGSWHSCGLSQENVLYCWGSNQDGQLGGDLPSSMVPVRVPGQQ